MDDAKCDRILYSASSCLYLLTVLLAELQKERLDILCNLLELLNQCTSVLCAYADEDSGLQKNQSKQVHSLISESLEALHKWLKKVLSPKIPSYEAGVQTELEVGQDILNCQLLVKI